MKPDRAWVRLGSGRRLDLLDPQPDQLEDRNIAVSLSRTYRWGGHSRWELPLSVAQHSLLVLVLRQQMQPHQPLKQGEALRELLHDSDLIGFYPVAPLWPHLGAEFHTLTARLQAAVAARYRLPDWHPNDHVLHKRADHLAAASEAVHVAGWHPSELSETLDIRLAPLRDDPLAAARRPASLGAVAAEPCGVPVPGQAARAGPGGAPRRAGRPDSRDLARGDAGPARRGLLPPAPWHAAPVCPSAHRQQPHGHVRLRRDGRHLAAAP